MRHESGPLALHSKRAMIAACRRTPATALMRLVANCCRAACSHTGAQRRPTVDADWRSAPCAGGCGRTMYSKLSQTRCRPCVEMTAGAEAHVQAMRSACRTSRSAAPRPRSRRRSTPPTSRCRCAPASSCPASLRAGTGLRSGLSDGEHLRAETAETSHYTETQLGWTQARKLDVNAVLLCHNFVHFPLLSDRMRMSVVASVLK